MVKFRVGSFCFNVFANEVNGVPLLQGWSTKPLSVRILSHSFGYEIKIRLELLMQFMHHSCFDRGFFIGLESCNIFILRVEAIVSEIRGGPCC